MKKNEVGETGPTKVQETKQAWLKAKGELDVLSKKISALEAKKEQAEKELKELEVTLANVEIEKSEALALIAIDEMEEAQFAEVKKRHEETKQRNDYLKELIPAIDHEKNILRNTYGELANRVAELRRFFWYVITEDLKTEIRRVTPDVHKLYLAFRLGGGSVLTMGDYLEERVFGRPTDEQREKLSHELLDQYENN
jgi:chromosome segregation ATPase